MHFFRDIPRAHRRELAAALRHLGLLEEELAAGGGRRLQQLQGRRLQVRLHRERPAPHALQGDAFRSIWSRRWGTEWVADASHASRKPLQQHIVFERYAFVFDVNGSLGKLRHVTPTSLGHLERLPLEVKKAHGQATTAPRTSISIDFHVFSFYLSIYLYIDFSNRFGSQSYPLSPIHSSSLCTLQTRLSISISLVSTLLFLGNVPRRTQGPSGAARMLRPCSCAKKKTCACAPGTMFLGSRLDLVYLVKESLGRALLRDVESAPFPD